jgi:hypothetical protein
MKLKQVMMAIGAALAAPAFAAIANGTSGNGELFLAVFDSTAKVSYTKDLGADQDSFFVDAQSDAGYTRSWSLDDADFAAFMRQANVEFVQWAVLASETSGGIVAGGQRLFSTVKVGDEAKVGATTNQALSNAIGSTQLGTFYNAVNATGSHAPANDFSVNGTSVNADTDPGNGYFGTPGSGSNMNGNFMWSNANPIGASSSFHLITRSGVSQLAAVTVDPFANTNRAGSFSLAMAPATAADLNGAYALTYALAPVPEPGTYALMVLGLAGVGFAARRRVR